MVNGFNDFAGFRVVRSGWGTLPPWGRTVVGIFAIPGLVLVGLSILAFLVSILALLLLTVPVYRLLQVLTGTPPAAPTSVEPVVNPFASLIGDPTPGRRHVEARVVDDAGDSDGQKA